MSCTLFVVLVLPTRVSATNTNRNCAVTHSFVVVSNTSVSFPFSWQRQLQVKLTLFNDRVSHIISKFESNGNQFSFVRHLVLG